MRRFSILFVVGLLFAHISFSKAKVSTFDDVVIGKEDFESALNEVLEAYKPIADMHGVSLLGIYHWEKKSVAAMARRKDNLWKVEFWGGFARRPEMTRDLLQMIGCHELAHHFAGFPYYPDGDWASGEGQADYYAGQTCLPLVWENDKERNAEAAYEVNDFFKKRCDRVWQKQDRRNICYRIGVAMEGMREFQHFMKKSRRKPRFDKPDNSKVERTTHRHPKSQCRIDSYVAGLSCSVEFDHSVIPGRNHIDGQESQGAEDEAALSSCMRKDGHTIGARPRCWFQTVADSVPLPPPEEDEDDWGRFEANNLVLIKVPLLKDRVKIEESGYDFKPLNKNFPWMIGSGERLYGLLHSGLAKITKIEEPSKLIQQKPGVEPLTLRDDWAFARIGIHEMDKAYRGSGVKIAVLDSGLNLEHVAYKSMNLINQKELHGKPGVDDDGNGFVDDIYGYDFLENDSDPSDVNGHGTTVTGPLAANWEKKKYYGVASEASYLIVRTHDKDSMSREDVVIRGLLYAADRGVDIINASWGGAPEADSYSEALKDAVSYAVNKGSLVVMSAGNDGKDNDKDPHYPSSYDLEGTLSVASSNWSDKIAGHSNWGKKTVDITAPGLGIFTTHIKGDFTFSTGTSYAAPIVSGAAAVLLEKSRSLGKEPTVNELRSLVLCHTDKLEELEKKVSSSGLLNLRDLGKNCF